MHYDYLTEICQLKQWKTISNKELTKDGFPVYGANGVIGYYSEYNHINKTILLGCRGTCGSVHISRPYSYINGNALCLDNLSESYDINYVYYFLKSLDYSQIISGTGIPQITQNGLKNVIIPRYCYQKQFKISTELSSIDELIVRNKLLLKEIDNIVKSRFIEMFGDLNKAVRLGDCCEVHARIGWQSLTQKEHMSSGEYMLITGTDFKNNEIDYSTCVYVSKERYEMDTHFFLKTDDVLITKDGTIGQVAVVHNLPKPATLNGGVFVVRPDNRFNKEYISYVFKGPLFEEHVEKSKTGATIKHLNQKFLIEFMIPVPAIDKQNEFAKFYELINKSKFVVYSKYFLCEFFTLDSSTIAYSNVVSIFACPNIFWTCSIGIPLSIAFVATVLLNLCGWTLFIPSLFAILRKAISTPLIFNLL